MDEFAIGNRVRIKTKFDGFLQFSVLPAEWDGLTGEIIEANPAAPDYGHTWLMYTVKLDPNTAISLEVIHCKAHEMNKL